MKFNSRRSNVLSTKGVVSTSQSLAAKAGADILAKGGSAVDAAVAAAAVLNVVEPMSTGIGGDVFALYYKADEKKVYALNSSGRSPELANPDQLLEMGLNHIPATSPFSVSIPGAVMGWDTIVNKFGNLDLKTIIEPAYDYALNGFPVSEVIAEGWAGSIDKIQEESGYPEFLNPGPPKFASLKKLPSLAKSLKLIMDNGVDGFYKGDTATKIANHIQKLGGWVTTNDISNHKADWVDPISTEYRDYTVWQCPPNTQGLNVLMALNIYEGFNESETEDPIKELHLKIESVKAAFSDGLFNITDFEITKHVLPQLLSKDYASEKRMYIDKNKAVSYEPTVKVDTSNTVYVTAVDKDGNGCSFINSLYQGFGSGIIVPDTGIALQNRGSSFSLDKNHPNYLEPNKRPFHTLIPGMVTNTKNNNLKYCYGVMGGMQQAQGHFQVLSNLIDKNHSPQLALDMPRFSVIPWDDEEKDVKKDTVLLESIFDNSVIDQIKNYGHKIIVNDPSPMFGGGQVIETNGNIMIAGSEPRKDGQAVGL